MGAVWYSGPFDPNIATIGMILLYLHGGAFVIGTASPDVCGFAASTLMTAFPRSKTLAISYRLASKDSSCAFPAALQDALTAYIYLLQQEIPAQQILLAADSAGCNLAIGLLRYLTSTHGSAVQLPLPKGAILCSPWIDVYAARSSTREFESLFRNIRTDYVPIELLHPHLQHPGSRRIRLSDPPSVLHFEPLVGGRRWWGDPGGGRDYLGTRDGAGGLSASDRGRATRQSRHFGSGWHNGLEGRGRKDNRKSAGVVRSRLKKYRGRLVGLASIPKSS